MKNREGPRMLKVKEAADVLRTTVRTLERWRVAREQCDPADPQVRKWPPFVRIGGSILYSSVALEEYLRTRGSYDLDDG